MIVRLVPVLVLAVVGIIDSAFAAADTVSASKAGPGAISGYSVYAMHTPNGSRTTAARLRSISTARHPLDSR